MSAIIHQTHRTHFVPPLSNNPKDALQKGTGVVIRGGEGVGEGGGREGEVGGEGLA